MREACSSYYSAEIAVDHITDHLPFRSIRKQWTGECRRARFSERKGAKKAIFSGNCHHKCVYPNIQSEIRKFGKTLRFLGRAKAAIFWEGGGHDGWKIQEKPGSFWINVVLCREVRCALGWRREKTNRQWVWKLPHSVSERMSAFIREDTFAVR